MNISRRRFVATGLAAGELARGAGPKGLFEAFEVNHVALRVRSLSESEEFYRTTFGAPGIIFEKPGQRYMRMGENFVALFERGEPAMDHFAISVRGYDADAAEAAARREGLEPRRSSAFVYVHDPDGIEVQIAHEEHEVHSPVVREKPANSVLEGNGINHVALNVREIRRSRDYYQRLFGLPVLAQGARNCFLGVGGNFLALFQGGEPGMNHFCISVEGFETARTMETGERAGLKIRREQDRLYFPDPNGLTVQVAAFDHGP
jgi:catechol 2,3-dioxygenase-like lactoylglutathione lyase family enzyme